ncbi:sensor histidine kinase KdpD [Lampropedia aestuarii]|uniref:histidine kinase n=1 Tax=Lampropedia aestuarii TaxID=2562762 RepID=A0A4S5BK90_9BURK|nr:sensor histidine kinase KdpD [Lampropedia aestuarii]THJ32619.1 sensor histidine kinase KdpD [Lampropedia aestuarii]
MGAENSEQADAMLGELQRQAAGRLTVFLGAAPGVGKTYAMLNRAQELAKQQVDVLVGVVETHGRQDTQAMLKGLAIQPRKLVRYRGRQLEEMDLDALLARRPAIVLVDELAHRNAPGSRHERRWQDVMELLDAGIDVYTTINVQHLESLNDEVHQITGVRVSETVPDLVFERLRDIRLVDLPARELIERLNQGKIYLPEQATQALQAFFSPSNLTALRELAMQTVASHVDADLRESRAARGLTNAPIQRHVLVAIDGRGQSEYLVRAGGRVAERRGVPWSVVSVDTGYANSASAPELPALSERSQARQMELDRAFALARNLGAGTEMLYGHDVAQALLDAAAIRGARSIVIGRGRESFWHRIFNTTLIEQLLARGAHYELTIVGAPMLAQYKRRLRLAETGAQHTPGREALLVTTAVAGAIGVSLLAERLLGLTEYSIIFLLAVLLVASRTRMAAAVVTSVLCFLVYNFGFIEPRMTLHIDTARGMMTMVFFLAAALIAGRLASRLRMQVVALRAANAHATAMQNLGRQLAQAADLGQVIQAGATALQDTLKAQAWLQINAVNGPLSTYKELSEKDRHAAQWSRRHGLASGRYTDTLTSSPWWFLPIRVEHKLLGVVGLRMPSAMTRLPFEQRRLAESMVDDIAQAAIRTGLVAELESARVSAETERLRSALLSSVSHDLRSPLASMIGAADSLSSYGSQMDAQDRRSLLETIRLEGERLDRYIQNLLDMTMLGQDGLSLTREWIGIDELLGSAIRRLQRYIPQAKIESTMAIEQRLLHVHPALVEQALFNVMENAVKFSPPDTPIHVRVHPGQGDSPQVWIDIADRGPGIPEAERRKVFDMFYSVERGDRGQRGTGLGLAIVQGIVAAHMGKTEALPGADGMGTVIRICLPLTPVPEIDEPHQDASHEHPNHVHLA